MSDKATLQKQAICIVGMDAVFGPCSDLDAFARAVYDGRRLSDNKHGDKGQDLLIHVLESALEDSGVTMPADPQMAMAIFCVADGGPAVEASLMEHLSTQWGFSNGRQGLLFMESHVFKALDRACTLLKRGEAAYAVIVAQGGLGAGAIVLASLHDVGQAVSLSSPLPIYAVIRALSLSAPPTDASSTSTSRQVQEACQQAFEYAGVTPADVGYLELYGGIEQENAGFLEGSVAEGLSLAYHTTASTLSCGLGSVHANVSPSTAMASLIKTILCLNQRYIPATSNRSSMSALLERWGDTPFYAEAESRTWFLEEGTSIRWAAINALETDGSLAHVILADAPGGQDDLAPSLRRKQRDIHYLQNLDVHLVPLAAYDREDVLAQLHKLQDNLEHTDPINLRALAEQRVTILREHAEAPYILALVAHDKKELLREITSALKGVELAFEQGKDWHTPQGSAFTTRPLGPEGEIAFVYPGAFNAYLNLGRSIFQLFPGLYDRFSEVVSDVGRAVVQDRLYPRLPISPAFTEDLPTEAVPSTFAEGLPTEARVSVGDLTQQEKDITQQRRELTQQEIEAAMEARLVQDPVALIQAGTSFAVLFTIIMRDYFHVHPQMALGYSLGEASMLWAAGVWRTGDAGVDAWRSSPLFKRRLSGPKDVVRARWGLDSSETDKCHPEHSRRIWRSYVLKAAVEDVKACLRDEERVYLTIINAPGEVVIAGDPEACQRVIRRLKCHALPVPYDAVIHNPLVREEYETFVQLYSNPVEAVSGPTFYSAAHYAPLTLERDALAHALAEMTCAPIDFPRLVNQVYDGYDGGRAGARIFIELGPLHTCTRWIDKILKGRDHVAVAINKRRHRADSDVLTLMGVLAKLLTHRVPVDLSILYDEPYIETRVDRYVPPYVTHVAPIPQKLDVPLAAPVIPLETPLAAASRLETSTVNTYAMIPRSTQDAEAKHAGQRRDLTYQSQPQSYRSQAAASMARASQAHTTFLETRHNGLRRTSEMIRLQVAVAQKWMARMDHQIVETQDFASLPKTPPPDDPVFDTLALEHFATGSIAACLGPAYEIYEHRRAPRIPNGDLALMSRVMHVNAVQGKVEVGASLVSEYDIPADAWLYDGRRSPDLGSANELGSVSDRGLPYAVTMEIALQPCGFLSAYMGSTLPYPNVDFYFRNLDGQGKLLRSVDLRGSVASAAKTIVNEVELLSSTAIQGIIIQKFSFALTCDDVLFYRGTATFGYFTAQALAKQVGLDGGRPSTPWYQSASVAVSDVVDLPRNGEPLRRGQLDLISEAHIVENGGQYDQGYVYAKVPITPQDWFFDCHFYQDPVMPGSLGVEAVMQAMKVYAQHQSLAQPFTDPVFNQVPEHEIAWAYRGQVTPDDAAAVVAAGIHLEVHIRRVEVISDNGANHNGGQVKPQVIIIGDASVWKGDLRIYQIDRVALRVVESAYEF